MVEPSGDDGDYLILGLAGVTTQPPPVRSFGPQTVETSAWESDDTYGTEGYAYRAAIVLSGATSDYAPEVNFSLADSISGNFAPVAETYDGGVYIYAKEIPQAAMNVPSIILMKG